MNLDEINFSKLSEIEQALEAATPGPWSHWGSGSEGWTTIESPGDDVLHHDERGHGHMREDFAWISEADAELIVLLRNSAPELIAEVRRLRACVEAVEKLANEWNKASDRELPAAERYAGYHSGARDARMKSEREIRAALAEHLGEDSENHTGSES